MEILLGMGQERTSMRAFWSDRSNCSYNLSPDFGHTVTYTLLLLNRLNKDEEVIALLCYEEVGP